MSRRGRALDALAQGLAGHPVGLPDWSLVFSIANDHLLTPALWTTLVESGATSTLPPDAADYLATLHRLNGDRNRALRRQAVEMIAALNVRGITPALLKGGLTLLEGPYADPAQRMMRDLDILVPPGARDDAIGVLERLGYRLCRSYGLEHHAFGDFARPNDPGSVDLHTELVDPSHILPASEVWARAAIMERDGVRYAAPDATDRVLHNLLHAQIHHLGNFYRGDLQVQQAYELTMLARHHGSSVDWPFIQWRMHAHRLGAALDSHLLAAHRLFGLGWPLSRPPGSAGRLHYARCRLQFEVRAMRWIAIPLANLRGAFAWHRMHALYGQADGLRDGVLRWRARHLLQYLAKKGPRATFSRLLRVD